ncbi:Inner membrane ABC transporter permease protein YcjP [compost metagenome]
MRIIRSVCLGIFLLIAIGPLGWLVISSLKTNRDFFATPFGFPEVWQLQNYSIVFSSVSFGRYFANSIFTAIGSITLTLIAVLMAAYILTFRFRGKAFWIGFATVGILIPTNAFMVPYYYIINWIGLYDSLIGLSLVYTGMMLPFTFLIIKNYMDTVPHELREAAYIDGASIHVTFIRVIVPVSMPSIVTASIFLFINAWNELLFANLLTQSESTRTLQVAVRHFLSSFFSDYPKAFAAMAITIIPTVIVYSLLSERIIGGLTAGAVK